MEDQSKKPQETAAFSIALGLAAILFIIVLNKLPFPDDYGFWQLTGIFIACCFVGGIIFGAAAGLINAIYKIIIEILVALLMLFNVVYIAVCWASFDEIIREMEIDFDNKLITILILAGALFIIDLIVVILLLPFARIANSSVLDV